MLNIKLRSPRALLSLILCAFILLASGCGRAWLDNSKTPIFTDPEVKIAQTASSDFTDQLRREAVALDPFLIYAGTQVHMGYWSGSGNRDRLVKLLDQINNYVRSAGEPMQKGIWDEGINTAVQYPSYTVMNYEYWYERGNAVNRQFVVNGVNYADPYSVTFQQADLIWAQYSQCYAEMADPIYKATKRRVKAWCFVQGGRANRIFYKYELPILSTLEQQGEVQVFFAKKTDSNWLNPADWTEGTANAPPPAP